MKDDRKIKDHLNKKHWIDGAPVTRDSIDGHDAELVQQWRVQWRGYVITPVKLPFYTDYASIPSAVRMVFSRIFPARSIYDFAALAHDIAYRNGFVVLGKVHLPIERYLIDDMFYDLMIDLINSIKPNRFMRMYYVGRAKLMYQMVSWFGGSTWTGYRDRDRKAMEKITKQQVDSARERANR
jgi:hypothetical protein